MSKRVDLDLEEEEEEEEEEEDEVGSLLSSILAPQPIVVSWEGWGSVLIYI